ncbi:hypothetical protein LUZ60_007563 [Juncus effusus]|nr:hypothetical protein LUZ60_007563 [Juncus effusus]
MPPHQVATKLALWAAVLTPMTKYALNIAPFTIQLENHLPSSMGDRTKMLICGIAGSVLLIVILILALTVPFFQYVTSLTGSMVSVGIVIIFPCAFYLRICGEQITRDDVVMHWMIIALGVDIAVCGTLSSADYLVQSFQKGTLV